MPPAGANCKEARAAPREREKEAKGPLPNQSGPSPAGLQDKTNKHGPAKHEGAHGTWGKGGRTQVRTYDDVVVSKDDEPSSESEGWRVPPLPLPGRDRNCHTQAFFTRLPFSTWLTLQTPSFGLGDPGTSNQRCVCIPNTCFPNPLTKTLKPTPPNPHTASKQEQVMQRTMATRGFLVLLVACVCSSVQGQFEAFKNMAGGANKGAGAMGEQFKANAEAVKASMAGRKYAVA